MADQESTNISTLDEAQATETLNDSLSFDDEETKETESSKQTENSDDTTDEADTDQQDDEDESSDDNADQSQDDESEEQESEPSEEEQRKQHNREAAERRIQEKQLRASSLKEQQDDYIQQADPDKPEDAALRQLQVDTYNSKIERNTDKLTTQYERAIKDFDVLSDKSPAVQREVALALDAFQAMHMKVDAYGNPSEVSGDLYQYLQSKADSIKELTGIGASQQVRNKGKEKSKAFTQPSRSPKQTKDPLMDVLLAD